MQKNHVALACPCGSGRDYADCCGRYHRGEAQAPTTEALLRARYSAFVLGDEDYLRHSWHPDFYPNEPVTAGSTMHWQGLEVLCQEQGEPKDEAGVIEYVARYSAHGRPGQLHERARYRKEQGRWYYVDGDMLPPASAHKSGRNDPCPCGSGKKFKKCCGC